MQGIWYEKQHDGCGFLVFVTPAGVAVYYFGHTGRGAQLWLHGFGSPDHIELTRTNGSGFPTIPETVDHDVVGFASLEFRDDMVLVRGEILASIKDPGFSPAPPAGLTEPFAFDCERLVATL